jgi:hypothetical protein
MNNQDLVLYYKNYLNENYLRRAVAAGAAGLLGIAGLQAGGMHTTELPKAASAGGSTIQTDTGTFRSQLTQQVGTRKGEPALYKTKGFLDTRDRNVTLPSRGRIGNLTTIKTSFTPKNPFEPSVQASRTTGFNNVDGGRISLRGGSSSAVRAAANLPKVTSPEIYASSQINRVSGGIKDIGLPGEAAGMLGAARNMGTSREATPGQFAGGALGAAGILAGLGAGMRGMRRK